MNDRIGRIYFGVLGIITLIFGITGVFLRYLVTCLEEDGEDLL